jgi:hypothetical protein
MVRLSIDLTEDTRNKLRELAERSGNASIEDFVRALLEDEAATGSQVPPPDVRFFSSTELESKLRDGIASADTEMTDSDWEQVTQQVQKKR